MAKRKAQSPPETRPEFFFQKELAGEQPPSFATMKLLYVHAGALFEREPWERLADEQLIALELEELAPDLCYCSIMGALGQIHSLHVYIGTGSYRLFDSLRKGEPFGIGDFYARQRSVSVEFAGARHLTAQDKQLLKAVGHPFKSGGLSPIFRSIRPGYHPWYVTESEARILTECIRAVICVHDAVADEPDAPFWDYEDSYPLASVQALEESRIAYEIRPVQAPPHITALPKPPALDEARIDRIRGRRLPSRGVLEVDHFYGPAMIGGKFERKALFRLGLAVEGETGIVHTPQVSMPEALTGDLLAGATYGAIELRQALPVELHVRSQEFKALLQPLAEALRFPVKVRKSLPALEQAKNSLLRMMGDFGPINPA